MSPTNSKQKQDQAFTRKTAHLYQQDIEFVNIYKIVYRAYRKSNTEALKKMIPGFPQAKG